MGPYAVTLSRAMIIVSSQFDVSLLKDHPSDLCVDTQYLVVREVVTTDLNDPYSLYPMQPLVD